MLKKLSNYLSMEEQMVYGFETDNGLVQIEVAEKIQAETDMMGNIVFASGGNSKANIKKAAMKFEEVTNLIKSVSSNVVGTIEGLVSQPNEFEMQFGIKLGGEAGVFVAKASTEANFSIKLKWVKEKKNTSVNKKG